MTCEEALKKLYEVIDKEADKIDVQQVQEHLDSCQSCMSRFEFERMFKHFVVEKASSKAKTAELKEKILGNIDKIEKGNGGFQGRPFRFGAVLVAAASALAICIVAAFSVAEYYRHQTITYPYEKLHFVRHLNNDAPGSALISAEALKLVTNDFHLALTEGCPGLEFVDAHLSDVEGNQLSHLRCYCDGEYISILVANSSEISLPDFEQLLVGDREYFRHQCHDCQVIYWYIGEAIVIAVSENVELDISRVIAAVEPI